MEVIEVIEKEVEVIEVIERGPQGPAGAGISTLTTKGDLLYRGDTTGERLPIGTSGQILKVAASGIPEWGAAPSSGVTSVSGAAPIVSSGGATPAISINAATTSSAGSMSAADKTKLDGIASGAEVNVNADWNAGSGDAQILNKPTIPTASSSTPSALGTAAAGTSSNYARADHVHSMPSAADIGAAADNDPRLSDTRTPTAHVASHAAGTKASYTGIGANETLATPVSIRANNAGTAGNSITLSFDGIDDIDTVLSAWNSANPSNQATLISGDGSQVPDNGEEITLSGGTAVGSDPITDPTFNSIGIGAVAPSSEGQVLVIRTEEGSQDSLLKAISTQHTEAGDGNWRGRIMAGAENKTFLMGCAFGEAGFGAHNWTSAKNEEGAGWSDFLINPDGSADVYIGCTLWDKETAILKVGNGDGKVTIADQGDPTKKVDFDVSGVTTETTRTLEIPDASGTLMLVGDEPASHTHSDATTSVAGFLSATDKTKLDSIASGAEVNVQADWNQSNNAADDYIKNKPTLGTAASASTSDFAAESHNHAASAITSGTIDTARLGSGTANNTTYLRGDQTWASVTAGVSGSTGATDNSVLRADGVGGSSLKASGLVIEDAVISFTGITGDASTDIITATGSSFSNGQRVRFTALSGGSGLNTTTNYFVINASVATFQLSTTEGGSAINFTTNITAGTLLTGHAVMPLVAITNNSSDTNSSLVFTPRGNGAIIFGPVPSGTVATKNARGGYAFDAQLDGGNGGTGASQVASGGWSAAFGRGNEASGNYSFCGAGFSNSATNTASAIFGQYGLASGIASFVAGEQNRATTSYTTAFGYYSLADRLATIAQAAGVFAARGDAQRIHAVLRNKTTTNSAVELFLDGSSTRLTVPSGKAMAMLINITGVKSDGSAVAHYVRQYALKNVGGTCSEVYAAQIVGADNASGTSIAISAFDQNSPAVESLKIECTGIASETWRWVASVDAVEVSYGT